MYSSILSNNTRCILYFVYFIFYTATHYPSYRLFTSQTFVCQAFSFLYSLKKKHFSSRENPYGDKMVNPALGPWPQLLWRGGGLALALAVCPSILSRFRPLPNSLSFMAREQTYSYVHNKKKCNWGNILWI